MALVVEMVRIQDLVPHPRNPRVHPDSALALLEKSLRTYGWTNPVLVGADGIVLAGHARIKAAQRLGIEEVPVIRLALSGAAAEAYLIADNRLAELTDWDDAKLSELLQELSGTLDDVEITGFHAAEVEAVLQDVLRSTREEPPPAARTARPGLRPDEFLIWHAVVPAGLRPPARYLISWPNLRGVSPSVRDALVEEGNPIFLDSGFLWGAEHEGRAYLKRQAEIMRGAAAYHCAWVAMLDVPIIPPVLKALRCTADEALTLHLRQAEEFADLECPGRRVWMVQGYDVDRYARCAEAMARYVGPDDVVGIGGLKDRSGQGAVVAEIVAAVNAVFPTQPIHLLGVMSPTTIAQAYPHGARSADASTAGNSRRFGTLPWGLEGTRDVTEMMGGPWKVGRRLCLGVTAVAQEVIEMRIYRALAATGVLPLEIPIEEDIVDGDPET